MTRRREAVARWVLPVVAAMVFALGPAADPIFHAVHAESSGSEVSGVASSPCDGEHAGSKHLAAAPSAERAHSADCPICHLVHTAGAPSIDEPSGLAPPIFGAMREAPDLSHARRANLADAPPRAPPIV